MKQALGGQEATLSRTTGTNEAMTPAPPPTHARLQRIEVALLNGIEAPEKDAVLTESAEAFLVKLFEERTR